jgi:hypothetical protein
LQEQQRENQLKGESLMKQMFTVLVLTMQIALSNAVFSQSTIVKLPTAANSSDFTIKDSSNAVLMKLFGDGGFFYSSGDPSSGIIPIAGLGTRLMWYPSKSAFRVGNVSYTQWDDVNIGSNSVAMGSDVTAKGFSSLATGLGSTAPGNWSTAMGFYTNASGAAAVAMGYAPHASGDYSTATGYYSVASGIGSAAIGYQDTASGFYSTAIGFKATASGNSSTAIGSSVSSIWSGSFILGDGWQLANPTTTSASDEMTMRFTGGYRLFTRLDLATGVTLSAGGSSWSTVSDSTKKTNFACANGEYFLSNLAKLRLGSWNYKTQDPQQFRHYGPMAQEIFHYFGRDAYGTIGNDTTLASADMDGIMMVCLQALEKRTCELHAANERLAAIERQNADQDDRIALLTAQIEKLTQLIAPSTTSKAMAMKDQRK